LVEEDLEGLLDSEDYEVVKVGVEPMLLSGGQIDFKEAYLIGDSWVLEVGRGVSDSGDVINLDYSVNNESDSVVDIPLFGRVDVSENSLPLITVLLGLADGFNPCAFFILTFLLAAMIYAAADIDDKKKKRIRIAVVGGIFVFFSGFVYFLFMSLLQFLRSPMNYMACCGLVIFLVQPGLIVLFINME